MADDDDFGVSDDDLWQTIATDYEHLDVVAKEEDGTPGFCHIYSTSAFIKA